jgi:hypothetical protein
MTKYSLRFLNKSNRIDDVTTFECDTDQLAQIRASGLFARSDFPAMELWVPDRMIAREEKPTS